MKTGTHLKKAPKSRLARTQSAFLLSTHSSFSTTRYCIECFTQDRLQLQARWTVYAWTTARCRTEFFRADCTYRICGEPKKRLSAQASISLIKRDRTNASVQWAAINEAVCAVIPWICEAADILLGCLRRGDIQRIGTIGTLLAQGMEAAHYTTSDLELEVRTLLNISKENASAPWQRKKHPSPA